MIRDVDLTVVKNTVTDIEAEQQRALEAVENAKAQIAALRDETEKNIGPEEAEIFDAHLMMLEDPDFVEGMTNEIADEERVRGVCVHGQLREFPGDVPRDG